MTEIKTPETSTPPLHHLRLWPGVTIVLLIMALRFGLPWIAPSAVMVSALAPLAGGLIFVLWWVFFSRASWAERLGGAAALVLSLFLVRGLVDRSITTAGMGMSYFIYVLPVLCSVFLAWALISRRLSFGYRWVAMLGAALLGTAVWLPLRTAGIDGEGNQDFEWRWAETAEDRLLAEESSQAWTPTSAGVALEEESWPGFRGGARNAVAAAARIATDWNAAPPTELWRQPIGPGWSSFAMGGDLIYTQEQRGEDEVVSCYDSRSGALVWRHTDAARFWESHAGVGPRATPTLNEGIVFSLGATGILNALDAREGSVLWSRNAATDTGAEIPGWGFSSSPLVVEGLVVVHAGALVAYDSATGSLRWSGEDHGSYSSPHLATIGGVRQIIMLSGAGATGVALSDGEALWEHPWTGGIVQPAVTASGDVLVAGNGLSGGSGLRRVAVTKADGLAAGAEARSRSGWTTEELWTSNGLKPNFSDFVVHKGHAYGFDGRILASINLSDGERNWKGGRYGHGQLVLLPDQDLLLVVSEKGELALVSATPDRFSEYSRLPAVEGKTWNHPVLVDDLLLVRNGQEMVAYRLALASG